MLKHLKNNTGATLIEIIAVLVILGILSGVAATRFTRGNADLVSVDAALGHHIRYAQSRSMFSDGTAWGIQIDTGNDDYWLVRADTGQTVSWNGPKIQPFGAGTGDTGFNQDRIRTRLVNVDIKPILGGAGEVSKLTLLFDNMGVPFWFTGSNSLTISQPLSDTQGLTQLAADITIPLGDNNGNSRSVTITRETGFVP